MMLLGNINAIPFRRRFGGGGGTPFPNIPGMIVRYSGSDLTNEDMSINPIWKDLTGNGYDLQMKNFGWAGMSGVNGYVENFNQYFVGFDESNKTVSDSSMKLVLLESDSQKVIYDRYSHQIGYTYNFYIKVTGIEGRTLNVNAGTLGGTIMSITEDGIYSINATVSDSWGNNMLYLIFPPSSSSNTVTIEQLPLYPGALVFDGVDDYGVCENFPILTKEKGYTVVALRQWITRGERALGLVSNTKNWLNNGAFLLEYRNIQADHFNKPISFGAIGSEMDLPHILTYQTSKSCNGVSITTGNFEGTDVLHVGKLAPINVGTCINAAIWELVFLDHDATEEELTKIKDYFVKTYPWLFPDQAWTVVGKTNEDEDRATIANITGNGNNLVLSNLGFAEGSGYGLYAENYAGGRWVQSTDRADLTWTSYSVNITSVKVASTQLYYQSYPGQPSFIVPSYKIKVYGLKDGQTLSYRQATSEGQQLYKISEDGTYTLPSFPFKANGDWYGFTLNKVQESCDITIEQIPEYEGYLVTDGVDDKITSSTFEMGNDWTVIGDWELLSVSNYNYAGIVKSNNLYVYNSSTGINIYVCSSSVDNKMEGLKSLKAICSDGRVYDDNWVEYKLKNVGDNIGANSTLDIGTNKNNFTKIAFKNLEIYNNKILSKEDCIKAYNYLQTLKAK